MTSSLTLGSYRLVAALGHGGMADVFLAVVEGPTGSGFAKVAVVKMLRSHLAEDPEFIAMLVDEARITARVSHPNIVQLFEIGEDDGRYFLAMEHLDGQPLHKIEKRLSRRGTPLPPEWHYAIISDVLTGLHHAHELTDYDGSSLGIVHRDITPQNIFVTYDGQVKIVDFGIAKAQGRATETKHGMMKGKLRYMSPEQAAGKAVDRRTDVFAAGILLFTAATGRRFWANRDEFEVATALVRGEYEASPRAVCPEVPAEIDRICRKALAFAPEDRYATADEMRLDLDAFLGAGTTGLRRELAASLRSAFARERDALKTVLRDAAAGHAASVDLQAFTATAGVPSVASSEVVRHVVGGRGGTMVMPSPVTAITSSASGSAPQSVPPMSTTIKPAAATPSAAFVPPRPPARLRLAATVTAGLVAAAVGIIAGASPRTSARAPARHASIVVSDRQTSDREARPRVEGRRIIVKTITQVVPSTEPAPAPARVEASPSPAPATAPAPASAGRRRGSPMYIDKGDPWAR